jgi:hypothetical protein
MAAPVERLPWDILRDSWRGAAIGRSQAIL